MPSYTAGPYILTVDQFLRGKSFLHWCPNTHLHSRRRMYNVYKKLTNSWNKEYTIRDGWYCPQCRIFEVLDFYG